MVNLTEENFRQFGKRIENLKRELDALRMQQSMPMINKRLHKCTLDVPVVTNPTLNDPVVNDPVITNTGTAKWKGPLEIAFDDDDVATSTITPTDGTDELTFSNDIAVNTGKFAATTVVIGNSSISSPAEGTLDLTGEAPYLQFKDNDTAGAGCTGGISSYDKNSVIQNSFQNTTDGWYSKKGIHPSVDNSVDLGLAAKQWKDFRLNGVAYVGQINLAATLITATGAELNILAGKTFKDEDNMASDSATGIASQQSIKAYVDAATNIGSANKSWIALQYAYDYVDQLNASDRVYVYVSDPSITGVVPLAAQRGGKNLYLSGFRFFLHDADSGDKIDRIRIFGTKTDGTIVTIYDDADDAYAVQLHQSGQAAGGAGVPALDALGYNVGSNSVETVFFYINTDVTTSADLEVGCFQVEYYYT
jgi:hypothetical protein